MVRSYFQNGFMEDSNSYNYTKDHLGSIWQVVDDDGETITSLTTYTPWGEQTITGAGLHSSFGYTGHLRHDEPTELALAQYRSYDSRLGRWLNRDPIAEGDGPNIHTYAGSDPIGHRDPLGLERGRSQCEIPYTPPAPPKEPKPNPTPNPRPRPKPEPNRCELFHEDNDIGIRRCWYQCEHPAGAQGCSYGVPCQPGTPDVSQLSLGSCDGAVGQN